MREYKAVINKVSLSILAIILVIYPATMFVQKEFRSEFFGVLFTLSVVNLILEQNKGVLRGKGISFYFAVMAFFMVGLIALVSFLWHGMPDEGVGRLAKNLWFILAIPVMLWVGRSGIDWRVVWGGIVLGAFVAFFRGMLEEIGVVEEVVWYTADHAGRANGVMHPIRFGDLSLLMGFLSLAGALYIKNIGNFLRILGYSAFLAGLFASVLSLSRGGWLAGPILLIITIFPVAKRNMKRAASILFLVLASVVVSMVYRPTGVFEKIDDAVDGVLRYVNEGDFRNNNVAARFEMVKAAVWVFRKSPVFGVGIGNYQKYAKQYYDENRGEVSPEVARWKNPHNEFALHLATRGVIGLAVILLLFLSLVIVFIRGMKCGLNIYPAVSGLLIVSGYFVFGLSIALFEHRDFLLFFCVYVPLFLSGVCFSEGSGAGSRPVTG